MAVYLSFYCCDIRFILWDPVTYVSEPVVTLDTPMGAWGLLLVACDEPDSLNMHVHNVPSLCPFLANKYNSLPVPSFSQYRDECHIILLPFVFAHVVAPLPYFPITGIHSVHSIHCVWYNKVAVLHWGSVHSSDKECSAGLVI